MGNIFLSYIKVSKFSGQTASTVLIKKLLADNYKFSEIFLYPYKRVNKLIFISIGEWIGKTCTSLPSIIKLLFSKKPILYINLGQSYFSFFRILWWYLPLRLFRLKLPVVISLNGHSFVNWNSNSFKSNFFKNILNSARIITVVGEVQKKKLQEIKLPENKIKVIPNTIDINEINEHRIIQKHQIDSSKPIQILMLSLLVESKGYPEYLEGLLLLAKENYDFRINAILCGPVVKTKFCTRFQSTLDAENWIEEQIQKINSVGNSKISVSWIRGAKGLEKQALFESSQVFILPTYYPNEAQPLVLLEALATGCSIITTTAGEIGNTITEKEAIIIKKVSPIEIANSIKLYVESEKLRIEKVKAGLSLYISKYSLSIYKKNWENIFNSLN